MYNQVDYWAHMLDESSHASYYEVYMQEHPEDETKKLIDTMLGEFADDLEKDHIDLRLCVKDGYIQDGIVSKMAERLEAQVLLGAHKSSNLCSYSEPHDRSSPQI